MDPKDKSDKRIIIEQVLNYGTWEQVKWVTKNYSWKEIGEVVKSPTNGFWEKRSLNYWTKFLKIKMSSYKYNLALMDESLEINKKNLDRIYGYINSMPKQGHS